MSEEAARAYLGTVEQRLAEDGCAPAWEDWGGVPVLVGRRADFRVRWAATRLHLFTVACAVPFVSQASLEGWTRQCQDYAKAVKGGMPLGAQTGIAVFPVLVSDQVEPAAAAWARSGQRVRFACMARPVVVDSRNGQVAFHTGRPALGRLYQSHIAGKARTYFTAA